MSRSPARAPSSATTRPSDGATWGTDEVRLLPAGRLGPRIGRDLRLARARDRPHPPRDGVINFAQGEMATFSTYIAWTLTDEPRLVVLAGVRRDARALVRRRRGGAPGRDPAERARLRAPRRDRHDRPAPDPQRAHHADLVGRGARGAEPVPVADDRRRGRRDLRAGHRHDRGGARHRRRCSGCSSSTRRVGLAMRAAAVNPVEARLVGVRVAWMLSLGWGLAAVLGAVSGMLAAPTVFLDPNMMQAILIYAFAAAVLGGIDSPIGAVVGGLLLGVGAQPDRDVRRRRRRRPAAAGRARRDPRRPARPARRDLRQAGGARRYERPRRSRPARRVRGPRRRRRRCCPRSSPTSARSSSPTSRST